MSEGLCKSADPDELFVSGAAQHQAATICRHCPVLQECAADALDNQIDYGVWGGMTERQRRALLKSTPKLFHGRISSIDAPTTPSDRHSGPSGHPFKGVEWGTTG